MALSLEGATCKIQKSVIRGSIPVLQAWVKVLNRIRREDSGMIGLTMELNDSMQNRFVFDLEPHKFPNLVLQNS